jgi:uncharacterized protein (TIGR03437 family)
MSMLLLGFASALSAAPADRISRPVDARNSRAIPGNLHRLAQPRFDQGDADPGTPMHDVTIMFRPSPAQQASLDQLLAAQHNPSSPLFHQWLTPEEFGNRFGISAGDQSKVVAWLTSEGLSVDHLGRGRNWVAFSGTAARVSKALHTSVHRFQIDGETHFANVSEPQVPEALADIVEGFTGLNDFRLQSFARPVPPNFNSGSSHFLAPEDFATIYNIGPLYQAGIDGTGQGIAVVGDSDVSLSDIRAFRTRYNLPVNDPRLIPYGSVDPGFNGDQLEANLDLEWAGAIAPKATISYVFGPSVTTAILAAISLNVAPVLSISYGGCEVGFASSVFRAVGQQANAQGITILAASGDAGAAGCDRQDAEAQATRGLSPSWPAAMPEVTGVGGTQFVEGTGNYWAAVNSPNFGSALSYIPEAAWNESAAFGLASSGGGASNVYPRPAWQTGLGVPNDNARHVPDIALSAAGHDAYFINYLGINGGVAGTSAAAPAMAGIVALLNQYQLVRGFQKAPGLGNINPQLYRLAQSAPSVFHDTTAGDNLVPCAQGSPDCLTGMLGYRAGPGYDMATGLGSVDANALVTQWNSATRGVTVTLSSNALTRNLNDTIQVTATVVPSAGSGTPTGTVDFVFGTLPLGSAQLANGSATLDVPLYKFGGTGSLTLAAEYSGDAAFSSGGAALRISITLPTGGVAAIIPSAPNTVWPQPPDAQGLSWQTAISLREVAGVPAMITGFTIDGQAQNLAQYFPSPNILPGGSVTANIVFRQITAPVTRTFGFTGVDPTGQTWSRQVAVNYFPLPPYNYFGLSATPLTVTQNTAADPSCQWSVQLNVDDLGGYGFNLLSGLFAGGINLTSRIPSIFGTPRLDAWSGLQGTLCFGGITPPASNSIEVNLSDGASFNVVVSFAGPPPTPNFLGIPIGTPAKISTSPAAVSLAASSSQPAQSTLAVNLSDGTSAWTASVYPANRTTSWLSVSQLAGVGSALVTLRASGVGFEPGVYRATIVLQSQSTVPQYINVPVIFVLGGSTSGTMITAVTNSYSYQAAASPGMLLSVFGSQLANAPQATSGSPLPYSAGGVTATINGIAAPLLYVSQNLLNIQVPFEVGAGTAVVGINNNGQIAGFQFQIAPAAPGIIADATGSVFPTASARQGAIATILITGAGEVSPALKTAYVPSLTTPLSAQPRPVQGVSVTVGGVPAFIQNAGLAPGIIGTTQVNFIVPSSVPAGVQPVVVTVGGIPSPAVNLTVQAP